MTVSSGATAAPDVSGKKKSTFSAPPKLHALTNRPRGLVMLPRRGWGGTALGGTAHRPPPRSRYSRRHRGYIRLWAVRSAMLPSMLHEVTTCGCCSSPRVHVRGRTGPPARSTANSLHHTFLMSHRVASLLAEQIRRYLRSASSLHPNRCGSKLAGSLVRTLIFGSM